MIRIGTTKFLWAELSKGAAINLPNKLIYLDSQLVINYELIHLPTFPKEEITVTKCSLLSFIFFYYIIKLVEHIIPEFCMQLSKSSGN